MRHLLQRGCIDALPRFSQLFHLRAGFLEELLDQSDDEFRDAASVADSELRDPPPIERRYVVCAVYTGRDTTVAGHMRRESKRSAAVRGCAQSRDPAGIHGYR